MRDSRGVLTVALLLLLAAMPIAAQAPEAAPQDDMSELAKKTQDPTAEIVSLPIQFNYYFDVGPFERGQTVINIQPVYPVSINDDWKLITRTILPVIDAPIGEDDSESGLGDLNATIWLSPKKSAITWGAGISTSLPTATSSLLGSEQWSLGPSVVVVLKNGPWVFGGLASQVFSIVGDDDRADVSLMTIQPFMNYNLGKGAALSYSPIITYDWEADDDHLTFPVGLGYSKTTRVGKRPMKFAGAAYYNVVRPDDGPLWQLQFAVTFLFPK
jgi:hypothetical protein